MVDFAALNFKADTRPLANAREALRRLAAEGKNAKRASDELGKAIDGQGRQSRSAASFISRLRDSLARLTTSGKGAAKAVNEVGAAATRAGIGANSLSLILARLSGAAAGVASVMGAGAMFGSANKYDALINQLKVLGMTQEQATARLKELHAVAADTRGDLGGTVQLYQRASKAARDLGASQSDVIKFTRAVNLAMAQTGTGGAAAEGALIQLSQALGGTNIQAEEFNSLIDGAYPLVLAAAQGIDAAGGSVGRLRQLIKDGDVTSKQFFEAIIGQSDKLQEALANTNLTVGQSVGMFRDSLVMAAGALNGYYNATGMVAQAVSSMGSAILSATKWLLENEGVLSRLPAYASAAAAVIGGPMVASFVAAKVATITLAGAMGFLRTAFLRIGVGALIVAAGELIHLFSRLVSAAGGVGNALALLGAVGNEAIEKIGYAFRAAMAKANAWEYSVKAAAYNAAAALLSAVIPAVNKIIGAFVAAGKAVAAAFKAVPGIVGDAVAGAVNFVVSGTEKMINGALNAINGLLTKLPAKMQEFIGISGGIGAVDLSGYMMQVSGAAGEAAENIQGVVDASMNAEYIGTGVVDTLHATAGAYSQASMSAHAAAESYGSMAASGMVTVGALRDLVAEASNGTATISDASIAAEAAAGNLNSMGDAADKAGGKAGRAGKKAAKGAKEAKEGLSDAAKAAEKFREELANKLTQAVEGVSNAFAEFVMRGFQDFKSFVSGVLDSFKQMLTQMIAMAAKNRIMLSLGIDPLGQALGAAAPALGGGIAGIGSGGPLGGLLGSALGSLGAPAAGGLLGGLGGVWGGLAAGWKSGGLLGALSGGLGSSMAGISSGLSMGGIAGITGAIGAAIPIIAGVAAVVSIGKKLFGRKLKDTGIEATFSMAEGLAASTYKFYKGGLFRSNKTRRSALDESLVGPLERSMTAIGDSVLDMAKQLGVADASLSGLEFKFKFSTKGLSDEEIKQKLQEQFDKFGDAAAEMAVEGLSEFLNQGEAAYEGLKRLASALTTANASLDMIGKTLFEVSLAGADMASQLADAFGGADGMASAMRSYFEKFYTEAEQRAWLERSTADALHKVNLTLPKTRNEYRAMVQGLDLTTKAGREAFAVLIGLSEAMDTLLPAVANLSQALVDAANSVLTNADQQIDYAKSMASDLRSAAKDWFSASRSLREQIRSMYQSDSSGASEADKLQASAAAYRKAMESAKAGDLESAKALGGLAQTYIENIRATSKSQQEFARREAMIRSELGLVAGIAELAGASNDVQAQLYENMVTVLQDLKAFIQMQGLTEDQLASFGEDVQALFADFDGTVASFQGQLASLEAAIEQSKGLTYETLLKQLNLNVDVIAKANLPAEIKQLLIGANDGITASVDFMVRSDLPPDLKWLALTQQSQHAKTVNLLAGKALPADIMRLAVADVSKLLKTIDLVIGKSIPDDVKRIALASSSELARTVNVILSKSSDATAIRLGLQNINRMTVMVNAVLERNPGPAIRRIILDQAGEYAAMISLVFESNMTDAARRVVLQQQGRYLSTIGAVLDSRLPNSMKALLLNATMTATKAVTILAAFGSQLTPEQRAALMLQSQNVTKTITSILNGATITPDQRAWLNAVSARVTRTITGVINTGALTPEQRALLTAMTGATHGTITLGGSFRFDPSNAFTSWYGTTTQTQITSPMNNLRASIDTLRQAIASEAAARAAEAARAANLASAQTRLATVYNQQQAKVGSVEQGIADIWSLAAKYNVSLKTEKNGPQAWFKVDEQGRFQADYDAIGGSGGNIEAFKRAFYAAGGVHDRTYGQAGALDSLARQLEQARAAVRALGGVPAFAAGGLHAGGLRLVGEKGPELEVTGPARIWNASDTRSMLGSEVADEVRQLREEVRRLREDNTSGQVQIAKNTRRSADLARKWDIDGQPEIRVSEVAK